MSKIVCTVKNGKVDVAFEGEHISKRELLLALKTIEKSYRRQVKEYQHCRKILDKEMVNEEAAESNSESTSDSGSDTASDSESGDVAGKTGGDGGTAGVGEATATGSGSKVGSVGK